jgi:uncharacterized membrane protein YccC
MNLAALRESLRWRPSDPGHFALRTALRCGIVVPVALALGEWIGNDQTALFAAFGTIAMLLFVDFGGPIVVRLAAYFSLAVACSGLIALGTLVSHHAVLAAIGMALVGFVVLFAGVLNGYFAAAASATLLTYILPALVPAEVSDIPARLGGWWIATGLAVPATLLLFPARPRDRVRDGVVACCRALAAYVRTPSEDGRLLVTAATDELHERWEATPFRPTGPTGATGALATMIDELDWLKGLALMPASIDAPLPPTPGEVALRQTTADVLLACADLLESRAAAMPDREALERDRNRVFDEFLGQLEDPRVLGDDQLLWAALTRSWDVRVLSYLAREIADKALMAGGLPPKGDGPRWLRFLRRQSIALAASERLAAAHAGAGSVWFRNSVRGAIGLAAAVLIAGELSVQHAFWVVLGSLSVLRSSALNTGATILQALVGTVIGVIIGGLLLIGVGSSETASWVVLPFAAFVAAYAPRAISFAAGQAGFTVAVFVIFDLLAPTGWEVGLIRVEDVSLGFLISLGVGLLFWPRGAGAVLRRAMDDGIAASARYAQSAFERLVTGTRGSAPELARAAVAAGGRMDVALRQRLAERPSHDLKLQSHARMISVATRLRGTSDAMQYLADRIGDTARPPQAEQLLDDARALAGWYVALGDAIQSRATPPPPHRPELGFHDALITGMREAQATGDRDRLTAAAVLAWAGLHLDQLTGLEARAAQAAADLS